MAGVIPWQVKMAAKILLSVIPGGASLRKRLYAHQLGLMDNPTYAFGVWKSHYQQAVDRAPAAVASGFTALELGPGDSVASALTAQAFGAATTYLVDAGPFARTDLRTYQEMASHLRSLGYPTGDLSSVSTFEDLLAGCHAYYMTDGLSSLRQIPSASVDFLWSHAVFQAVWREELLDILRELKRIMRPTGIASHRVDLRDCMGGALNNLRFGRKFWEGPIPKKAGFYTNRVRYSELMALFEKAGFRAEIASLQRFETLPTPRSQMNPIFRAMPEDELNVAWVDVVLYPA